MVLGFHVKNEIKVRPRFPQSKSRKTSVRARPRVRARWCVGFLVPQWSRLEDCSDDVEERHHSARPSSSISVIHAAEPALRMRGVRPVWSTCSQVRATNSRINLHKAPEDGKWKFKPHLLLILSNTVLTSKLSR